MALPLDALIIRQKLGNGEYGEVFEGYWDSKPEKSIAYKFIRINNFDYDICSTLRELFVSAELGTRGSVFRYTTHGDDIQHGFVTENTLGACDMNMILLDIITAPISIKIEIFLKVIAAVSKVHECGIMHRDIKPGNFIVRFDPNLTIDLVDFSLSIRTNDPIEKNVITLWWRAPEVLLALPYTMASDVWSVGMMLAQFLDLDFPRVLTATAFLPLLWQFNGQPSMDDWPEMFASSRIDEFKAKAVPQGFEKRIKMPKDAEVFRPLLEGLLQHNPLKRWTLAHATSFLESLRCPAEIEKWTANAEAYTIRKSMQRAKEDSPKCILKNFIAANSNVWSDWETRALDKIHYEDVAYIRDICAVVLAKCTPNSRFNAETESLFMLDLCLQDSRATGTRSAILSACVCIAAIVSADVNAEPQDTTYLDPKMTFDIRVHAVREAIKLVMIITRCTFVPRSIAKNIMISQRFIALMLEQNKAETPQKHMKRPRSSSNLV